jgi:hypothetical protein
MFRVGDIVQAQLSFVVIPVKAGRRRMLTVLRSLALLDEAFTINSVSLLETIQRPNTDIRQGGKTKNAICITNFEAQGWIQRRRSNLWWGKKERET